MIQETAPLSDQPFQLIKTSGDLSYSNNNNTVKLLDRDGGFFGSSIQASSGALKLEVKPGWSVQLRVVSGNSGFFNGNVFQDNFWDRHDRISRASGGDDFIVNMIEFETIEFDVDRTPGNGIADFKLVFQDKSFFHDGLFAPNDPFWITLESAQKDFNDDDDEPPVEIITQGLELIHSRTPGYQSPFNVFTIIGDHTWKNSGNTLRLADYDRPTVNARSGAATLEVKEGHYVDLNIMNEDNGVFNAIGTSLSLNPRLISEDFNGGNSDFTIRLYGGSILFADTDGEATDLITAFGGAFYLSDGENAYAIQDHINDEYEITLLSWGLGEDPHLPLPPGTCEEGYIWDPITQSCVIENPPPVDEECPEGYIYDPETETCILIPPVYDPDPSTDPFDLIDGMDSPFEEGDDLIDRLVKSFTFGVNGSFRAIEAVIEGVLIALPAVIVIGSAVVMARVLMKATEKGAAKVAEVGQKSKGFLGKNSIKIEGVGME